MSIGGQALAQWEEQALAQGFCWAGLELPTHFTRYMGGARNGANLGFMGIKICTKQVIKLIILIRQCIKLLETLASRAN
jgi:hypothetical protein